MVHNTDHGNLLVMVQETVRQLGRITELIISHGARQEIDGNFLVLITLRHSHLSVEDYLLAQPHHYILIQDGELLVVHKLTQQQLLKENVHHRFRYRFHLHLKIVVVIRRQIVTVVLRLMRHMGLHHTPTQLMEGLHIRPQVSLLTYVLVLTQLLRQTQQMRQTHKQLVLGSIVNQ